MAIRLWENHKDVGGEEAMAKKGGSKWIQKAVKHPGALRAKAKAKGLIKGKKDKLTEADLDALAAGGDATTKKQVGLAKTFKKMRSG